MALLRRFVEGIDIFLSFRGRCLSRITCHEVSTGTFFVRTRLSVSRYRIASCRKLREC